MAFPENPLGLRTELLLDGVWTDITKDVYTRAPITHQRGIRNEGAVADPASVPITINNKSGKYSNRNPMSPYYGLIGRNTRVRLSLPGEESYLQLDGDPTAYASTPDTAALDLTMDLDLRWEGETDWYSTSGQVLIGKWSTEPGNRSYCMRLERGLLFFHGGRDGTAGPFQGWVLPELPRRAAVRVTLTGGSVVRHYWAETMDGPWTQIGTDVTLASPLTTGLFVGTAPLLIAPSQYDSDPTRPPVAGRVYRAEVRSAGGTVVASPDFRSLAAGAAGVTDSAGRAWTLTGTAEIRDRIDRFIGEISEWPQQWVPSEADMWVPVQAAGILRRLGRGSKPLDSALRRRIPSYEPMAYWPMEEGQNATKAYSPVPGVDALSFTRANWAADSSLVSSGPLPTIGSQSGNPSHMYGAVRNYSWASLPAWSVNWMYRMPQTPAARQTFMLIYSTGTVRDWYIQSGPDGSRIGGYDRDGNALVDQLIATSTDIFGDWVMARFAVEQVGSTVRYSIVWSDITGSAGFYQNTVAGVTGRPSGVSSPPGGYSENLQGMAIGHISVWPVFDTAAYDNALDAWSGETAGARMLRLAAEEGVPVALTGPPTESDPVGYQGLSPVLDLVKAGADSDGGMLTEDQTALRLLYRPRSTLYSQEPGLVLDYSQGQVAAPLDPVDDDTDIRNDVTVERDQGASARVVLASGPLSVLDPPDGVGVYNDSQTLSLDTDAQAEDKAYWELHLGTWDEPRYPAVSINLHRHPSLIPAVLALREGDVIRLTNMPKWIAPDDVDLMVRGLKETLLPRKWEITYDCVPAGPWRVGVVGDDEVGRVDTDGSTLALPSSATDGQLLVHAPAGARPWATSAGPAPTLPAEFPFDVRFGGETARVTACAPAAYDAFGRTVSNGWGVADCGFSWVGAGGADSDRSVSGGIGVITLVSAKDAPRFQRVISQITDCEVVCRMTVSQVATGSAIIPAILLRYVDVDNFYRARVRFDLSGAMAVEVTRAYTQIGASTVLPFTYTAGAWFRVRARITGDRVQLRVWPDAQPEPSVWHVDQTITTAPIPAGQVGVTASTFGGNSNANPAVRYDDFQVVTPQLLTVERSLNGIIKTHPVGEPVGLATPAIVAL
ncbi:hypothetical protein [Streptomyces sp. ME01-18h]|uniref:hypothetical protein n=1 Tax=Streptomyces sp. ME01-18h TaxID=462920 RepID=UPI0029B463F5|nr:hypothetical protein [Streptomyces sp. ME01-18h]MDX3398452.1 hypothetical protein [Streptomyces sp. ME01-18h]